MVHVRFKLCSTCNTKREWYRDACPSCGETTYETVQNHAPDLVADAIGETVTEPLLFDEEIPRVTFAEEGTLTKLLPDAIRNRVTDVTVSILNEVIADYLQPGEQPHFILRSMDPIQREQDDEQTELHPTTELHYPTRVVITDQRILMLVGQDKTDIVDSEPFDKIRRVESESSLLTETLILETGASTYRIDGIEPYQELSPAITYIRAQTESGATAQTEWSESDYEDLRGEAISDQVKEAFAEADLSDVLKCGVAGARFGVRAGAKGSAVGFVMGTAVGIWSGVSSQDPDTASPPEPETVATDIKQWQQSGAKTGDEKVEWMAAATGAAVTLAAANADHEVVDLLDSIDPANAVRILELGSTALATTDQERAVAQAADDSLPDIEHLREPAADLAGVLAELFEAGLFEEVMAAAEESN